VIASNYIIDPFSISNNFLCLFFFLSQGDGKCVIDDLAIRREQVSSLTSRALLFKLCLISQPHSQALSLVPPLTSVLLRNFLVWVGSAKYIF